MGTSSRLLRTSITAAFVFAAAAAACDSAPEQVVDPAAGSVTSRHDHRSSDMNKLIAAARAATAKYHRIEVAQADGYISDGFGCVSDPSLGAMGEHYINLEIDADPAIDLSKPELLLYEPGPNGTMTLVGVEYEVFQADWWAAGNTQPPSLFGHEFEPMIFPGLDPLFGLHVWLWRHNPESLIQSFNHAVSCP